MKLLTAACVLLAGSLAYPAFAASIAPEECPGIVTQMMKNIKKGQEMGCESIGDAWDKSRNQWIRQCRKDPDGFYQYNAEEVVRLLNACSAQTDNQGGSGGTASAVESTDVYPNNDGNSDAICTMRRGDKGKVLAISPDEENWVKLGNISGRCGGKSGWVWDGGSLRID